jgi:hypothetical protein
VRIGSLQLGASEAARSAQSSEAAFFSAFVIYYRQQSCYFISGMSESKSHVSRLETDNYYAWSYRMEMRLRKLGVWSIVNGQEPRPLGSNNHKTVKGWVTRMELALNEIVSAVGDSQLIHTRVSRDANVIWERLDNLFSQYFSENQGLPKNIGPED